MEFQFRLYVFCVLVRFQFTLYILYLYESRFFFCISCETTSEKNIVRKCFMNCRKGISAMWGILSHFKRTHHSTFKVLKMKIKIRMPNKHFHDLLHACNSTKNNTSWIDIWEHASCECFDPIFMYFNNRNKQCTFFFIKTYKVLAYSMTWSTLKQKGII